MFLKCLIPQVLDYVQVRADLYELTKTMKTWERKVDIAQVYIYPTKRWIGLMYSFVAIIRSICFFLFTVDYHYHDLDLFDCLQLLSNYSS